LVQAFRKAGDTPLVDELDRVVAEIERLEASAPPAASGLVTSQPERANDVTIQTE
jgi:hypothetical protein